MKPIAYTRGAQLPALLQQRIVIIDGAMGTMIQRYKLAEADYRGERFKDHPKDLKNNGDLLSITRPDVIGDLARRQVLALDVLDQRKLEEYFSAVRDVELRIQKADKLPPIKTPDYKAPTGLPDPVKRQIA